MRLLWDTHVLIKVWDGDLAGNFPQILAVVLADGVENAVSVASFWEIAIKVRLGKLKIPMKLEEMGDGARSMALEVLPVTEAHVLAELEEAPTTKDPFDRLLLTQAQVEDMRLLTLDRALVGHKLAFRPN